jgi:stearoyl-CoA 9-desaturase NADPH oxidoreductase
MPSLKPTRIADRAQAFLRSPLLNPLNDVEAINDFLALANPLWSLDRIRARLVEVVAETADTKTFVFAANRLWAGHRAGQHVVIEIEINGRRYHRTFTVASAPSRDARFCLTIKRTAQGPVSRWLHESARVGDVITVSAAGGDFVLPQDPSEFLLMISAGSGITPVMSMLRELHAHNYAGNLVSLHVCRTRQDEIFGTELRRLASEWPALELKIVHDSETGYLDAGKLKRLVPDYAQRQTYLCGPPPFMQMVRELWASEGLDEQLSFEYFGLPPAKTSATGELQVEVSCARSDTRFETQGTQPLLAEVEAAGLSPAFGCRIGICKTCQCRKRSGTVENLLTGEISSEPNQVIQLCISAARSNVELDL